MIKKRMRGGEERKRKKPLREKKNKIHKSCNVAHSLICTTDNKEKNDKVEEHSSWNAMVSQASNLIGVLLIAR